MFDVARQQPKLQKSFFFVVKLDLRYLRIGPRMHAAIQGKLAGSPTVYSIYDSTDICNRHILTESRSHSFEKKNSNESLPNRIVFALVAHDANVWSYKRNLINFHQYNTEEILPTVDALTVSYRIDVQNKIYMELFSAPASQLGNKDCATSSNIWFDEVLNGTALFPFDLTSNHSNEDLQPTRIQTSAWN